MKLFRKKNYRLYGMVMVCLHNPDHSEEYITRPELQEIGGWLACEVCEHRMWHKSGKVVKLHGYWMRFYNRAIYPTQSRIKNWRSDVMYNATMDNMWGKKYPMWLSNIVWALKITFVKNARYSFEPSEEDNARNMAGLVDAFNNISDETRANFEAMGANLDWLTKGGDEPKVSEVDDFDY
jgi:hypothetical protein